MPGHLATVEFAIPEGELRFRASRSSGPGGQHVNKSSTRVEVLWNVRASRSLSPELRGKILERLAGRIDRNGVIRVVASSRRSQLENRQAAIRRLQSLIQQALREMKPRVPTAPPERAKQARIETKRKRAEIKRFRRKVIEEE
ncbi:MAG: aminoacyl-tRNA hydrolase [Gemmatimonadales bacterium]|nr:Peptidyl-tRNA hydrolase ArfB [bacterium HR33]GIW53378.1 MAG: aminoacyl-tRNA hydrolase [Gemmatimonadales bacterium]